MVAREFWKKEPKEPWSDWRTYSMLVPIACGALGACIFFALGLSFAEIASIRPGVRKPMILVASFGVAIGSTFGSIGSGIEVFRKSYKGQARVWDWVSLSISTVTTIAGMIIGVATLLGGTTDWSREAVIWGSAVVCGLAALDAAGDMIELGGLFGSHEDRMEIYLEEKAEWDASQVRQVEQEIEQWDVAEIKDFRRVLGRLNGEKATLTKERLAEELAKDCLLVPSRTTENRWLKMARGEQ